MMFQFFKTYVQSLPWNLVKQNPGSMQLSQVRQLPERVRQPVALEYGTVRDVMLITEFDEQGEETPLALAFITKQNSGMTLVYLQDLSELE